MPTASRMNGRESEETTVPDQPQEVKHRGDVLRFGIFELDTEAGQLYKNGRVVRLQPKPFKLLCLLAEKSGDARHPRRDSEGALELGYVC